MKNLQIFRDKAAILEETLYGEVRGKLLTSVGAGIIAYEHYRNYRLCQQQRDCACPEHRDELST